MGLAGGASPCASCAQCVNQGNHAWRHLTDQCCPKGVHRQDGLALIQPFSLASGHNGQQQLALTLSLTAKVLAVFLIWREPWHLWQAHVILGWLPRR